MPAPLPRTAFLDSVVARLIGGVLLAAALLAAYANSFQVPLLLDDADSIVDNPTIRHLGSSWLPPADGVTTTSGRPLLNISLAINYAIHGKDVFGYHVGNLLIHFLAALVLWGVVRRTLLQPALAARFTPGATPLAWCAAALWALHPLQTESVTYIIQRAESLVGLCYFLTLYGFIRSTGAQDRPAGQPNRFWPACTVLACLAGMAAKEVMASAPLVLFLYDRTFVSGTFARSWRAHRRLYVALACTWLVLLSCIVQSGARGSSVGYAEVAWWEYALTQAPALVGYAWRALWPANLIFDYGAIVEKNPAVVVPALLAVILALGAGIQALRRRPVAGFAFAWFFLILAPSSSIVPVATQTVAEHRMYLPLAALVVPAVLLLHRAAPRAAFPICLALLAAAGSRTHSRNGDYRDSLSIWADTAQRVPDSPRARNNHGAMLLERGRTDEAVAEFRAALELSPTHAQAWHNLGNVDSTRGRFAEAIGFYRRALELEPENASFHASLGHAYLEAGQPEAAVATLRAAVALAPDRAVHSYNLASVLMRLGRTEEAGPPLARALELMPDDLQMVGNYAVWLRRSGRAAESVTRLEEALRTWPDSALLHSHLGVALLEDGRVPEGIRALETALPLDPKSAQTRYNLGIAYARTERPGDAIPQFEALLQLSPPTAELLDNLGTMYALTGRYDDALATFQKALALDPAHRNARSNLEAVQAHLRRQSGR